MGFLSGKRILITGLLSNKSIAAGIAAAMHREGAQLAFTYQTERFKERVEKLNMADSLIFQTEKQLKEFGEKIPADKKSAIESALKDLKEAHAAQAIDLVDKTTEALNAAWHAASEDLYKATQEAESNGAQQGAGSNNAGGANETSDVTDAEFEEVTDK